MSIEIKRVSRNKLDEVCKVLNEVDYAARCDITRCAAFKPTGYHARKIDEIYGKEDKGDIERIRVGYLSMGRCTENPKNFWISTDSGYTNNIDKHELLILIEALTEISKTMQ